MKEDKKLLIERYKEGLSDNNERQQVELMFLSGDQDLNKLLQNDFEKVISEPQGDDINLDHLLEKIYSKAGIAMPDRRTSRIHKIKQAYMHLAAVVMIPVLLASIFLYANKPSSGNSENGEISMATIYAPLGSRISFDLPDGTKGMLNSGSSLSYSLPFSNNRNIELTGEGWFEVKEDTLHPFVINTVTSSVRVLGTSFNLSAYPDQEYVEIVLNKGKVEFVDKKTNEKVYILSKERLVSENGKITKSMSDTSRYKGWTEGKLIFKGDTMEEVARRISKWYNVDIVLADEQLQNYSFRGIFKDDKLEDILSFLAMTSPIKYDILPREVLSDGSFSKEKIIISIID